MTEDYMELSSGEDSDSCDLEIEEYEEKCYEELKDGKHIIKLPNEAFTCPFCSDKKKHEYQFKDLFQHATMVGKSDTKKRSKKDKANHLALSKYLKKDTSEASSSSQLNNEVDHLADHDGDEMFVWPWKGIVVNLPIELTNGRYVGKSGSSLRDDLTAKGFNPTRVTPLWNFNGHSGTTVVEFKKDITGYKNAMKFEKLYIADNHGEKDWKADNDHNSGIYGWIARADDYMSNNIIGDHLRKIADLRTFSDIVEEKHHQTDKLKSNLTNVNEVKKRQFEEMESKYLETESALRKAIAEKEKIYQSYNEEIKKIQLSAREHIQRIKNDHEKIKLRLEREKKELELQGEELQKREAVNENERKKLAEEIAENAARNSSLRIASDEQRKADESVMKLADDHTREKQKLDEKIISLEQKLDEKQALELELEGLKGQLNVMKHTGDDVLQILKKIDDLNNNLKEKKEDLDDAKSLFDTLVVQEREKNDALQDARKELIEGLKELPKAADIGLKRIGELEDKPFLEAMKRIYNDETEAEDKASELCSLWEEYLRDPHWHPFKRITQNGKLQEIIDENDKKLKRLKRELGEQVHKAVCTALREINEFNPSGRYVITELWKFTQGRKATLEEGVSYLLKMWDAAKEKRRRIT